MDRLDPLSSQLETGLPQADLPTTQDGAVKAEQTTFDPAFEGARANFAQGSFEIAYNQFKSLEAKEILAEHVKLLRVEIYACIERITNLFLIESIEDLRLDIMRYRALPNKNGSHINGLCVSLIRYKYRGTSEETYALKNIAADDFLLDCLDNDYYPDPDLEKFLTDIRRQLLLSSVADMAANEDYLALYQALAFQGYLTDYVFFASEDEQQIVSTLDEELGNLLGGTECTLQDITSLMMLLSMYRPLVETNAHPSLEGLLADQLPEYLQAIFSLTYLEPLDLNDKANKIVTLGDINEQSLAVQEQYEEAPYPKYGRLNYLLTPVSYRDKSPHLQQDDVDTSVLDNNPLEILVAGCGTGFHALRVAMSCANARVTAIDISRKSLAYGQRLKTAYGASNVEFFQADMLEIADVFQAEQQRFHVIECVGVLHHLSDMNAGLAALNSMLVPGGILHLGLYSQHARQAIAEIRKINARIGVQPTPANIRQFRRQLMMSELNDSIKNMIQSRDFYNLHGCRDLLFNSQESNLTIPELERLLAGEDLEFLGFCFGDSETYEHYDEMFPADESRRNLHNWNQLEQIHPQTFSSMYKFHCRKPSH